MMADKCVKNFKTTFIILYLTYESTKYEMSPSLKRYSFISKAFFPFTYGKHYKTASDPSTNYQAFSKSCIVNIICDDPTATNKERQLYYLPNQQNDEPGN